MLAKILIADDHEDIRRVLRDFLEARHHEVLEATDGAQAFMLADKETPHLIIMDVVMPGVYGTTAVQKLHDYAETAHIPVIIISGSTDQKVIHRFLQSPRVRFLPKPVDLERLEATIRELLPKGGYTP